MTTMRSIYATGPACTCQAWNDGGDILHGGDCGRVHFLLERWVKDHWPAGAEPQARVGPHTVQFAEIDASGQQWTSSLQTPGPAWPGCRLDESLGDAMQRTEKARATLSNLLESAGWTVA